MNQDFKELIAEFSARGVRFLIVGAHALAAHGQVRATKDPGLILQIGLPPVRIDVLTSISGVDFESAWADRLQTAFAGIPCSVLGRKHLILAKRSAGRAQDLADVEFLESLDRENPA